MESRRITDKPVGSSDSRSVLQDTHHKGVRTLQKLRLILHFV